MGQLLSRYVVVMIKFLTLKHENANFVKEILIEKELYVVLSINIFNMVHQEFLHVLEIVQRIKCIKLNTAVNLCRIHNAQSQIIKQPYAILHIL